MKRLNIDEISDIIQHGEDEGVEFKYGTLVLDVVAKCIAAFANAKGGRIIVGYSQRRQQLIGSSAGDMRTIEKALKQIENPPTIDCYEIYYKGKHLLIVDIEPNKHDFSYYKGAIFVRVNSQVQLMNSADIKAAYSKFTGQASSPYNAIEKMNIQNLKLQGQVSKLEEKMDNYHKWDITADKISFRWAVFFCVAGSVLGAIIGTILGKIFL